MKCALDSAARAIQATSQTRNENKLILTHVTSLKKNRIDVTEFICFAASFNTIDWSCVRFVDGGEIYRILILKNIPKREEVSLLLCISNPFDMKYFHSINFSSVVCSIESLSVQESSLFQGITSLLPPDRIQLKIENWWRFENTISYFIAHCSFSRLPDIAIEISCSYSLWEKSVEDQLR